MRFFSAILRAGYTGLGVEAGVHIETLPVIPASRLDEEEGERSSRISLLEPLSRERN